MSNAVVLDERISTMAEIEIDKVRQLEVAILQAPQVKIETSHIIHAGMYARTIMVPAGVTLTGALMIIPTILIIQGNFLLFIGGKTKELRGYNIFTGGANRKQAGVALSDTCITMIFPTSAKTIEEAEEQFTNETHILFSRYPDAVNHINITGE